MAPTLILVVIGLPFGPRWSVGSEIAESGPTDSSVKLWKEARVVRPLRLRRRHMHTAMSTSSTAAAAPASGSTSGGRPLSPPGPVCIAWLPVSAMGIGVGGGGDGGGGDGGGGEWREKPVVDVGAATAVTTTSRAAVAADGLSSKAAMVEMIVDADSGLAAVTVAVTMREPAVMRRTMSSGETRREVASRRVNATRSKLASSAAEEMVMVVVMVVS